MGGTHHASVFFGDEIATGGVGSFKIVPVACQQVVRPGKELAEPHLVEHRPVALACGTSTFIVRMLEFVPFQTHDMLDEFGIAIVFPIPCGAIPICPMIPGAFFRHCLHVVVHNVVHFHTHTHRLCRQGASETICSST